MSEGSQLSLYRAEFLPLEEHEQTARATRMRAGVAATRYTIGGRNIKIEKQNIMIFKIRIRFQVDWVTENTARLVPLRLSFRKVEK